MRFGNIKNMLAVVAAATLMCFYGAGEAQASWGSFGSSGGSWGGSHGFGSSGGSSGGSWGSSHGFGSHGGPIRNMLARHRARKMARHYASSGGSSGGSFGSRGYSSRGWGSSGGSSGGYYRSYSYYSASSGGSSGHYRSYGSSGGYGSSGYMRSAPVYSQPTYSDPGYSAPTLDGNSSPMESTPDPAPTRTNALPEGEPAGETAMLNLRVPTKAVVYVNGNRTSTPGSFRSYVSRNLKPGRNYTYEVRAEMEQNGEKLSRTKVIQLTAGDNKTFELDFDANRNPVTSVTLFVPEDANVTLGGVATNATGSMRYFSTSNLKKGESWDAYNVVVTVERDGKQLKRERTIDVNAGDSVNLRFDFEADERVASR